MFLRRFIIDAAFPVGYGAVPDQASIYAGLGSFVTYIQTGNFANL